MRVHESSIAPHEVHTSSRSRTSSPLGLARVVVFLKGGGAGGGAQTDSVAAFVAATTCPVDQRLTTSAGAPLTEHGRLFLLSVTANRTVSDTGGFSVPSRIAGAEADGQSSLLRPAGAGSYRPRPLGAGGAG